MSKSKLVNWEEEVGNKDGNKGIVWMKIENGKKHVFRPVGKPIRFYRHAQQIDGKWQRIIVDNRDENILKECHKVIEPLFDKIFNNQKQIHTLEQIRDTLLPKLMSGEVKVDYNGSP